MMSTIDGELLTFFGSSWKKGNRSHSRRKPAGRNLTMGFDEVPRKGDEPTTASDTEKNGVDILGRHFRDKLEHVPIKKRRFQVASPSWNNQNSPVTNQLTESSSFSKRRRGFDMPNGSKISKQSVCDDFSGIEILATVACDKEIAENGSNIEDVKPLSSLDKTADSISQRTTVSSRVHWDLNVSMDAWETPCSTMTLGSSMIPPQPCVNTSEVDGKEDSEKELADEPDAHDIYDPSLIDHSTLAIDTPESFDQEQSIETEKQGVQSSDEIPQLVLETDEASCVYDNSVLKSEENGENGENGSCRVPVEVLSSDLCKELAKKSPELNQQLSSSAIADAVKSPSHNVCEELVLKSFADSSVSLSEVCRERCVGSLEDGENSESNVCSADKIQAICSEEVTGYDSQFEDGEVRESNVEKLGEGVSLEEQQSSVTNLKDCKVERRLARPCPAMKPGNGRIISCQKNDLAIPRTKNPEVTVDKDAPAITRSMALIKDPLPCTGRLNIIRPKDPQSRPRVEICPLSKDEKETSRKFVQGRSPKSRSFIFPPSVGYWNSERRSSISVGPYRSLRPKPVLDNRGYSMASDHSEFDSSSLPEADSRSQRNYMNMSSEGQCERFTRRTPNERDEGYSGVHRDSRNEYPRPLSDDMMDYSNRQRLVARERSTSPLRIRRSLFRSRSRSPGYFEPSGSRFQSRSPFLKRLAGDYVDEISPSRARFSPQHGSRGFDDRNISLNRKSPVRGTRSSQRFDSGHGFPRLNSSAPYRSLHSGGEYDGNDEDERRKGRDRFEVIHRMRPYDNEIGDGRRYRYEMEEPFEDSESTFNNSRRKLSEWRSSSGAPYKASMHSRKVNPLWRLNADSPYRSSIPSRNEYGDYDDRRKGRNRYEMAHRLRRYDTEGAVNRLRYDPDDLFDGSHSFTESTKKLTNRRNLNRASDDD